MRMEMTDSGCLKVWLSEEDLAELGLTFESLDYEDPVTRDAMKRILAAAQKETGFPAEGGLMVEALPLDGGCLLLFTPVSQTAPAAPEGIWATAEDGFAGNRQIFLQWKPNREYDLMRYRILRSEDGGDYKEITGNTMLNVSAYTDMTTERGKTYRYIIKAQNFSGAESGASEPFTIEA